MTGARAGPSAAEGLRAKLLRFWGCATDQGRARLPPVSTGPWPGVGCSLPRGRRPTASRCGIAGALATAITDRAADAAAAAPLLILRAEAVAPTLLRKT